MALKLVPPMESPKRTPVGDLPVDWECVQLRTMTEAISKGTTPTSLGRAFAEEGVAFIKIENVTEEGNIITESLTAIDEETNRLLARSQLQENDVLFSIAGALGRTTIVPRELLPANTNQAFAFIRLRKNAKLTSFFLVHYLRSRAAQVYAHSISVQGAQANLSLENVRDLPIPVPGEKEQVAIATALNAVDSLVKSLDALIAKKRAIKQGVMQALLTGKKRLPGFTGLWQTRSLGEMLTFLRHASKPRADLSDHESLHYLHYGDVHAHSRPVLDCSSTPLPTIDPKKVPNVHRLEPGDLVVADASEDLEGTGKSVEVSNVPAGGLIAGLHTIAARGRPGEWAPGFKACLQFMRPFKVTLEREASGLSVYAISKKNIARLSFPLPDIKEQAAIVEVLENLEEEIAILRARRAKLSEIKVGMMQNLLTGRIRLPTEEGST